VHDTILVVVVAGDRHTLVLDASKVHMVDDAALAGGAVRSLCEGEAQRALLTDRGWLIVDDRVELRRVDRDAFVATPAWLESVRWPLLALVRIDEGFACQVDIGRLFDEPSDFGSFDVAQDAHEPA
jgi:hypothetical protein